MNILISVGTFSLRRAQLEPVPISYTTHIILCSVPGSDPQFLQVLDLLLHFFQAFLLLFCSFAALFVVIERVYLRNKPVADRAFVHLLRVISPFQVLLPIRVVPHLSLLKQRVVEFLVRDSVHCSLGRAALQVVHCHSVDVFLHLTQQLSFLTQNILLLLSHNGVRCFQRLFQLSFRGLGL